MSNSIDTKRAIADAIMQLMLTNPSMIYPFRRLPMPAVSRVEFLQSFYG
jgi:hypothetical protein